MITHEDKWELACKAMDDLKAAFRKELTPLLEPICKWLEKILRKLNKKD